jgi:predicted nucleotidyltransferase
MNPVSVPPLPTDNGAEKTQFIKPLDDGMYDQKSRPFWGNRMKPSDAFQTHRVAIRTVVERHHASNARVFGSVLHGDDREGSDLDILIDPTPETTLFDIGAIRHELLQLLGVPVDVLTPNALPEKFRAQVLAEARPV